MDHKFVMRVAAVAAAFALCALLPFRAFAQSQTGVEDDNLQMSVPARLYAMCMKKRRSEKDDLKTCQEASEALSQSLKGQEKQLKVAGVTLKTDTAGKVVEIKTAPKPAPLPPPVAQPPVPPPPPPPQPVKEKEHTHKDLQEQITDLKSRVEALKKLVDAHATHATSDGTQVAGVDKLIKDIEELTKALKELQEQPVGDLGRLKKTYTLLLEDYAKLLTTSGVHDEFVKGLRKKFCAVTTDWEWKEDRVAELCGTSQIVVTFSAHSHVSAHPGAPAKVGAMVETTLAIYPGSGTSGLLFGLGFGEVWGTQWRGDREYVLRPKVAGSFCHDSSRSTCWILGAAFEVYTWAGAPNDPQLPSKLRSTFGPGFGWTVGATIGVKQKLTKHLQFSFEVMPGYTPNMNYFDSGGKNLGSTNGFVLGAQLGLSGSFDLF